MADLISSLTATVAFFFRHRPAFSMTGIGCPLAITNRRSRFSLRYTSNMQPPSARAKHIAFSRKGSYKKATAGAAMKREARIAGMVDYRKNPSIARGGRSTFAPCCRPIGSWRQSEPKNLVCLPPPARNCTLITKGAATVASNHTGPISTVLTSFARMVYGWSNKSVMCASAKIATRKCNHWASCPLSGLSL